MTRNTTKRPAWACLSRTAPGSLALVLMVTMLGLVVFQAGVRAQGTFDPVVDAQLILEERFDDPCRTANRMTRSNSGAPSGLNDDPRYVTSTAGRITSVWLIASALSPAP